MRSIRSHRRPAAPRWRGPALALLGLPLAGCFALVQESTATPLRPVEIPLPAAGGPRPSLSLQMSYGEWGEARAVSMAAASTPSVEHDDRQVDEVRDAFVAQARALGMFSALYLDPVDRPKADYRARLRVRHLADEHAAGKALATGLSEGLVTTTIHDDLAVDLELRDRQGRLVQSGSERNAALLTFGVGALAIADRPALQPPKTIPQELAMKTLRTIALSGIYAKPASVAAATASAPPAQGRP